MLLFLSTLLFTACNSQAPEETKALTTPVAQPAEEVRGLLKKLPQPKDALEDAEIDLVLFVLVDTLRADILSVYGAEQKTVGFDALAEMGVVFENAYSPASWTRSTMASLFTGLYPTQISMLEEAWSEEKLLSKPHWREKREQTPIKLPVDLMTLPISFKGQGFSTGSFVNQPALHPSLFRTGFDHVVIPSPKSGEVVIGNQHKQKWASLAESYEQDQLLYKEMITWIENTEGKKFAWLHMLTTHKPYDPIESLAPKVVPKGLKGQALQYAAEVQEVDQIIGDLVTYLKESGRLEKTAIVLTSDHGEGFGEHKMYEHGHTLQSEVTHVPLIVVAPQLEPGKESRTVSTLDSWPTLMDIVGGTLSDTISGRSLFDTQSRPIFSEAMLYGSTERMLIDGEFKFIEDVQSEEPLLYNLKEDPKELKDLAAVNIAKRDELSQKLKKLHEDLLVDQADILSGSLVEETTDMNALKELGYIE